jgi:hypothetical protein
MIRNPKTLWPVVLAVFALSAIAAPAAQAEPKTFHVEIDTFTLKGEQVGVQLFTFAATSVECEKLALTGENVLKTTAEITTQVAYSECNTKISGKSSAKVVMNGCDYRWTVKPETEVPTTGVLHVECPVNKRIEILIGAQGSEGVPTICNVTLGAQTLNEVIFENAGTGKNRDYKGNVGGSLSYTQDGVFCPGNEGKAQKSFTNGTYAGEMTFKAFNAGEAQVGTWIE